MVFDNAVAIGRDTRIREVTAANLNLIFTHGYWYGNASQTLYRPLTTLSYLFNYAVLASGTNLVSYHWINFLVHAANTALVYLLVLLLLEEAPLAFAAAAIWSLHPILTESVTNIVGRADLLAAFGILAALLCYIQAVSAIGRRRFLWLAALALSAAIAIFSKENGIVVIPVLFLYDLVFRSGPSWRSRVPGYLAAALPVALFLTIRTAIFSGAFIDPIAFTDNPLVAAGFWTARLTAIQVFGRYLLLLVWPYRLSCDYSYNQIPLSGLTDWKTLVSLAAVIALAAAAIFFWRRSKPVCFLIAFSFAALLPTANLLFPIGTIMAERFLYLPAIAIAVCGVLTWRAAGKRWTPVRSSGSILLALVLTALAIRTWARNSDWADNLSLWSNDVQSAPASYKTHGNLAAALEFHHDREASAQEAERSLAILASLPDSRKPAAPYAAAARAWREMGDATADPAQKSAWYRKALDTALTGRRIDREQSRLLHREAGSETVYLELGRLYQRLSQPHEALEALEYGRRFAHDGAISEELATLYQSKGEWNRAAISYMESLAMNPDNPSIPVKLAELYRRMDPAGCALANGALNLNCPLVHTHLCTSARNLGQLYRSQHRTLEAETVESQAIRNFGCSAGSASSLHE
jgi:tetratricopeptide (TPR) repeat protein